MPKNIFIEDIMVRDVACATLPGSRDEVLKILKNKHISGGFLYSKIPKWSG